MRSAITATRRPRRGSYSAARRAARTQPLCATLPPHRGQRRVRRPIFFVGGRVHLSDSARAGRPRQLDHVASSEHHAPHHPCRSGHRRCSRVRAPASQQHPAASPRKPVQHVLEVIAGERRPIKTCSRWMGVLKLIERLRVGPAPPELEGGRPPRGRCLQLLFPPSEPDRRARPGTGGAPTALVDPDAPLSRRGWLGGRAFGA